MPTCGTNHMSSSNSGTSFPEDRDESTDSRENTTARHTTIHMAIGRTSGTCYEIP